MTISIQLTRQREETGTAATDLNKTSTIEKSADPTLEISATSATATKALPSMVEVPGACEEREVCEEVVAALTAASDHIKGDLDATLTIAIVMRETSKTSRKSLNVAGATSEAACAAEALQQEEHPCGVAEAVVEGTIAGQTCAAEMTSTLHPDGASTERTSSMTEAVNNATTTTLPSKEKEEKEMTINNVIREET